MQYANDQYGLQSTYGSTRSALSNRPVEAASSEGIRRRRCRQCGGIKQVRAASERDCDVRRRVQCVTQSQRPAFNPIDQRYDQLHPPAQRRRRKSIIVITLLQSSISAARVRHAQVSKSAAPWADFQLITACTSGGRAAAKGSRCVIDRVAMRPGGRQG